MYSYNVYGRTVARFLNFIGELPISVSVACTYLYTPVRFYERVTCVSGWDNTCSGLSCRSFLHYRMYADIRKRRLTLLNGLAVLLGGLTFDNVDKRR